MGKVRQLKLPREHAARRRIDPRSFEHGDKEAAERYSAGIVEMRRILQKTGAPHDKINWAIEESLKISAAQRDADDRRHALKSRRYAAAQNLKTLIEQLELLSQVVLGLAPSRLKPVAEVLFKAGAKAFDTESWVELVHALEKLPPLRRDQQLVRAWPELITLWEGMPPETRVAVEDEIPRSDKWDKPRTFFSCMVKLLRAHAAGKNFKTSLTRELMARQASIWLRLGLKVGLAYDGMNECNRPGLFEQYCSSALSAVGDSTTISRRQVKRQKASHR